MSNRASVRRAPNAHSEAAESREEEDEGEARNAAEVAGG